jgi:hypothetical protein
MGPAQIPLQAGNPFPQKPFYFPDDPLYVNNRVAGKDLGKPISQVAGQAFPGSFLQDQTEGQYFSISIIPFKPQADIIGAFLRFPIKGLKKLVRLKKYFSVHFLPSLVLPTFFPCFGFNHKKNIRSLSSKLC